MITAPHPADETERLAELRAMHVLDTPPEQRFDRLIDMAKRTFSVPIAYLALIDADRQWFKAKRGLCELDQTPRNVSFCGHAILSDTPTIVPDALQDERFVDNPMVTGEPNVRFYAGVPLKGPGGHNIATLCLVDTQPRQFDDGQVALFKQIAEMAQDELNMVHAIEAQRKYMQTQQQLSRELRDAAEYVRSQLPEPLDGTCGVHADYVFITSSQLGGDMLGYHALDENRLAIYLLDVTGHGVGASLLSVSVVQGIRQNIHRDDPAKLLASLNTAFPMEEHHSKFFTIWYGIYDRRDHTLRYATGGHPPAVLLEPGSDQPVHLGQPQLMLGVLPDASYQTEQRTLTPGSRLYLYSDGAFEVTNDAGGLLGIEGLTQTLADRPTLEQALQRIRDYQGANPFTDDFSLLQIDVD